MKARIIKNNTYNDFLNRVSIGDKISDFGYVYDENNVCMGLLVSTGYATKTGVHFESNAIIHQSLLHEPSTRETLFQKLAYGKYILCSDELLTNILLRWKDELKLEGIVFGDIFMYDNEKLQYSQSKSKIF